MSELNIKFGQIPFWAICRFSERTKIELAVFAFICAKRFRSNQEADCSRHEILEYTNLDKSQVSVAIKKLISIKWIEVRSKTRWFIPEIEPEKVDKSSTKKPKKAKEKVDDLSTKVDDSTTKVDDLSTFPYKEDSSDTDLHTKDVANATGGKPPRTRKISKSKIDKRTKDERSGHVAIQTVRSLMGRYPDKLLWTKIINRFGEHFNKDKLTECRTTWLERGYNPNATTWMNWYFDGIPERNGEKNNAKTATGKNGKGNNTDQPDHPRTTNETLAWLGINNQV